MMCINADFSHHVVIDQIFQSQSENVGVLRDGNSTIYPLSKDCVDSIKDPHWPDLPPVSCLGVATHFLHGAGAHQKNHVALLVLALKTQTLMPKILRCDPEGVRQVLTLIENDTPGRSCHCAVKLILNVMRTESANI